MAFNPNTPNFSSEQILNQVYDEADGSLRVDATVSATVSVPSIGPIGSPIPGYANLDGAEDPSGNLQPLKVDGSGNLKVTSSPSGVQAVSQSGVWTVGLTSESIEIGTVDQGTSTTIGNGWYVRPTDGVNSQSYTASGEAKVLVTPLTNSSVVKAQLQDNSGTAILLGQTLMASSLPVTFASNQSALTISGTVAATQSGTWNLNNITGTISLPTGASTSALQTTGNSSLASILSNQTNGTQQTQITNFPSTQAVTQSGTWTVQQGTPPWSVSQSGTWTTGRTWTLLNTTDSVNVGNFPATQPISGTITAKIEDSSGNSLNSTSGSLNVDITNATLAVTQSTSPWVISGTVSSTQSGTWNINNISGTISLPTGAATSANQTNGTQITQVSVLPSIPAGSNAIGSVTISNFPTTQPISGTVTANQGTANATPWNQNISQFGGAAVSLGQELAANSIPVVTQADATPSVQNITTQDIASTTTTVANGQVFITGTPTAGSSAIFLLTSFASIEVQVTGTWTGTLQTEVTTDGGTTWITRGIKQTGSSYNGSSYTANFEGGCNFAGMVGFRVRAVSAMTGTASVKIVASTNVASLTISNPLTLRDSVTQSITNTIKAASTASVATDTALVVAMSPNSSLPTGSNVIGSISGIGSFTSSTSNVTSVASSATNVSLLASNTSRKAAYFYNDSTQVAYIKLGTIASTSSYTLQMAPLSFVAIDNDPVYTGEVDAIWVAANGNMRITELT